MKTKCDNCGLIANSEDLDKIKDPTTRIGINTMVPAGQCTACGALSYNFENVTTTSLFEFDPMSPAEIIRQQEMHFGNELTTAMKNFKNATGLHVVAIDFAIHYDKDKIKSIKILENVFEGK